MLDFIIKLQVALNLIKKGPRKRKRDNSGKTKKKNEKRKLSKRKICNGAYCKRKDVHTT